MLKRGTKFRIAPYGVCVVSNYDDTSGKYIMRVWNSNETFYASQEEIDKKCLIFKGFWPLRLALGDVSCDFREGIGSLEDVFLTVGQIPQGDHAAKPADVR